MRPPRAAGTPRKTNACAGVPQPSPAPPPPCDAGRLWGVRGAEYPRPFRASPLAPTGRRVNGAFRRRPLGYPPPRGRGFCPAASPPMSRWGARCRLVVTTKEKYHRSGQYSVKKYEFLGFFWTLTESLPTKTR